MAGIPNQQYRHIEALQQCVSKKFVNNKNDREINNYEVGAK